MLSLNISQETEEMLKTKAVQKYKQTMIENLQSSYPDLTYTDLEESIIWAINNNHTNPKGKINNNYTKDTIDGTIVDILKYIDSLEPIITSSGVLFKRHKEADNPLTRMIMGFLSNRKIYKDKMKASVPGSQDYERYNLYQLLEKQNANASYGILASPTSLFYNIYVSSAITRQGQSYISASITLFEAFFSDNVKFNSLNEIITFITNVVNERNDIKYDDNLLLDENINKELCFFKIMKNFDPLIWIPSENEMKLVWDRISNLDQQDLNRVFYKNNLYGFCNNTKISEILIDLFCSMQTPFVNPNKPPKCIIEKLDIFTDIIMEYVYYRYPYIDKIERVEYMQRDTVAVSDTDSAMISLDAWYRYCLEKLYNIDMPIKHQKYQLVDLVERDEFGDIEKPLLCESIEPEFDYDFYTDEVIEKRKLINLTEVIPQENLRYSIINLMAHICSKISVDYLDRYCSLANSNRSDVKCKLVMINSLSLYYRDIIL